MCNYPHKNSTSIKKQGTGWKLFSRSEPRKGNKRTRLVAVVSYKSYKKTEYAKWVKWKSGFQNTDNGGFCFFLTKKEALKALRAWNRIAMPVDYGNTLVKIRYNKGMVKHTEKYFINRPIRVALCKEFKLDEVDAKKKKYKL